MFYEPLPGCITSNVRSSNSLERHETWVRYTHAVIEPNRTNKKIFELKKKKNQMFSLNVSRKTSGTRLECFIFERVRLSYWSSNEVELFTEKHEWNKIVQLIKRWNSQGDLKFCFFPTVEPVCNPVLSGHLQLSGQFSKSRFFAHTNAVFITYIRLPPLLRGR